MSIITTYSQNSVEDIRNMTYNQYSSILERISVKVNWDYKVILSPYVQEENFISNSEHPLSHQQKIVKKDRMTIDDLRSLKMMAQ